MIQIKIHPDGEWLTTEYKYEDRKILIKSRKNSGMKAHCFLPNSDDKVDFTLRWSFIKPELLLKKVINKIKRDGKS